LDTALRRWKPALARLGALVGNQFSKVRPRLPRKSRSAAQWANATEWLTPTAAIYRFCSREAVEHFILATNKFEVLNNELEALNAKKTKCVPPSELTVLTNWENPDPEITAAAQMVHSAAVEEAVARQRLFGDLRGQLQRGRLVARAAPVENDYPREWRYLKAPNWAVLNFDPNDPRTVRGNGKIYRGVMIGRHEATG
jgi:hypothetical protein